MPLVVGDSTSATGWRPAIDLKVGSVPVQSVHVGAASGSVELWRRGMAWEQAGLSKTITAPTWAKYIDIIALGAGGGGVCGNGGNATHGNGGNAGQFASTCWATVPGRTFVISVGVGGAGGTSSSIKGKSGGATVVTHPDLGYTLTAPGGGEMSGQSDAAAKIPGSYTYVAPTTYTDTTVQSGGSPAATRDRDAPWPGGGGGGGGGGVLNNYSNGRVGAAGIVWYRFRAY